MLESGIGSGSCDPRSAFGRMCREKSACAMSWRDGRPVPGVIRPMRFPWCRRTRRRASAISLSFVTTAAQSNASSQPSFSKCTARFTSEPFSCVLNISTFFRRPIGRTSGAQTLCVRKTPVKHLNLRPQVLQAAEIHILPLSLRRIGGSSRNPGSEILDCPNVVMRTEHPPEQQMEIKPFPGSSLQSPVEKIESVHIDNSAHWIPPKSKGLRRGPAPCGRNPKGC